MARLWPAGSSAASAAASGTATASRRRSPHLSWAANSGPDSKKQGVHGPSGPYPKMEGVWSIIVRILEARSRRN